MKKTFKKTDGTEETVEGTPEELAEYERRLKENGSVKESSGKKPGILHGKDMPQENCCEYCDHMLEMLKKISLPVPLEPLAPWDIPPTIDPWLPVNPRSASTIWIKTSDNTDVPCMYDNLEPGLHMIACPCPRHAVICSTSGLINGSNDWRSGTIMPNSDRLYRC